MKNYGHSQPQTVRENNGGSCNRKKEGNIWRTIQNLNTNGRLCIVDFGRSKSWVTGTF